MPCPQPSGLFVPRDPEGDLTPIPAPCGKWDCPHCGKIKKNKLLDRVKPYFKGERVRMWTLTIREGCDDEQITKAWARIRANLAKQGLHGIKFFWGKEFQKNGTRHLHVLISARVGWDNEKLAHYWHLATEQTSWQVDKGREEGSEELRNPAGYICKYMDKGFAGEPLKMEKDGVTVFLKYNHKERRWGASRGFPPQLMGPIQKGLYVYRSNTQVDKYGVPGYGSQDTHHEALLDRMNYRVWRWWRDNWRALEKIAYSQGEAAHQRFLDDKARYYF